MTRINVIDPELLSNEHLGAEYRELPRVFGLVRDLIHKGKTPKDILIPSHYRLGQGHVTFFYDKLRYLSNRYLDICRVCRDRGRQVNYGDVRSLTEGIPEIWFNDYEPTDAAIQENLARITERGGLISPRDQFRFMLRKIPSNFI